MPSNGLSSFLRYRNGTLCHKRRQCQCPPTGSLHFYDIQRHVYEPIQSCVNALQRALFISTVSPHTPLKSRPPDPIFACNCLNFLTITLFRKFFGVLKNCTYFHTILNTYMILLYHNFPSLTTPLLRQYPTSVIIVTFHSTAIL